MTQGRSILPDILESTLDGRLFDLKTEARMQGLDNLWPADVLRFAFSCTCFASWFLHAHTRQYTAFKRWGLSTLITDSPMNQSTNQTWCTLIFAARNLSDDTRHFDVTAELPHYSIGSNERVPPHKPKGLDVVHVKPWGRSHRPESFEGVTKELARAALGTLDNGYT
jgi:hypothetical protein